MVAAIGSIDRSRFYDQRISLHNQFEQGVKDWLAGLGYRIFQTTYHETLPDDVQAFLRNRHTPTALHLRQRADRMALHPQLDIDFEFDVKTTTNSRYKNISLEMLPLAQHVMDARIFGVRCLYIHRDPFQDREIGFWAHDLPAIDWIGIPDRWTGETFRFYLNVSQHNFPNVPIRPTSWNGGSGTPYVIINEGTVEQIPHWKTLIGDFARSQVS